jgi:hypothetical protein
LFGGHLTVLRWRAYLGHGDAVKLTTISILIALVALFEIGRTVSRVKRDRIGIRSALLWACMWSGIGYFAMFPSHLDRGLELAQMENRMFFITVLALLVLFTLVFSQASQIERLKQDVAHMVQELALTRARIDPDQPRTRRSGPDDESPGAPTPPTAAAIPKAGPEPAGARPSLDA